MYRSIIVGGCTAVLLGGTMVAYAVHGNTHTGPSARVSTFAWLRVVRLPHAPSVAYLIFLGGGEGVLGWPAQASARQRGSVLRVTLFSKEPHGGRDLRPALLGIRCARIQLPPRYVGSALEDGSRTHTETSERGTRFLVRRFNIHRGSACHPVPLKVQAS